MYLAVISAGKYCSLPILKIKFQAGYYLKGVQKYLDASGKYVCNNQSGIHMILWRSLQNIVKFRNDDLILGPW